MKQLLAAVALWLLIATQSHANQLFEQYIQWIVENSDLEYNGEPLPGVVVITGEQLQIMAYGEEVVADAQNQGVLLPDIVAIYDHLENNIVIPPDLDLQDWNNHHVVVHELVHYLQKINGYFELQEYVECPTGLEELAYDLHVQWMDQVGHPGERPNEMFLYVLLSSCYNNHL